MGFSYSIDKTFKKVRVHKSNNRHYLDSVLTS